VIIVRETINPKEDKMAGRKKEQKLSPTHTQKLGKINIVKGTDSKGEMTYSWDVIQKCRGVNCPAAEQCPYVGELTDEDDCRVMKKYMRSVSLVMFNSVKGATAAQRYQIGMHIIPLYKTLCKMKIEELGITAAVSMTSRGTMQVNPIYKEMREIIKVIDSVWRSIGVGRTRMSTEIDFSPNKEESGNYYDAMEKEAFASMGDKVTPIRKK
jgi:hypothetical protein